MASPYANGLSKEHPAFRIHLDSSVNRELILYLDVDVAKTKRTDRELVDETKAVVSAIEAKVRAALMEVLKDRELMGQFFKTAAVSHQLEVEVAFEKIVARIDFVRTAVESPEDRERAVRQLNAAVATLGSDYQDVEVTLLQNMDAVMGYDGLYVPNPKKGGKSEIRVPLSFYGTTQLRAWDDILKILAHELAHHAIRKNTKKTGDAHRLDHTVIEHRILGQLRRLDYLDDGTVKKAD
ncbi:MAG: hypothetical protein HY465_05835 [Deltaproteobacteria bacterium]|nr:hypothetical protein [Deltaproteobacteria bacterium]